MLFSTFFPFSDTNLAPGVPIPCDGWEFGAGAGPAWEGSFRELQVMHGESSEAFARQFAAHHRRLFGYIRALVPNRTDAEEVFQETCVALWGGYEQYDPQRSFAPWALAMALNQVRNYRHRQRRQHIVFSDALLEQLSIDEGSLEGHLTERTAALDFCLELLPEESRATLRHFYVAGSTAAQIARQTEQKVNTIYKVVRRLRLRLLECIERRLASENR